MKRFLHAGERYAQSSSLDPTSIYIKHTQTHYINLGAMRYASTFAKVARAFALVALFCLITLSSYAKLGNNNIADEPKSRFTTLKIGQKLAKNFILGESINHPNTFITSQDFKGKAVIIDVWATWCGACIAYMPKTDSLQKVYKEHLKFFLLNRMGQSSENMPALVNFYQNFQQKHPELALDYVAASADGKALFPGGSLPKYIWIDVNGRVKAITSAKELTGPNIERLLAGLSLNLKMNTR